MTSQSTDIENEALLPESKAVLGHGQREDAWTVGQTSWELRASVPHHPQKGNQLFFSAHSELDSVPSSNLPTSHVPISIKTPPFSSLLNRNLDVCLAPPSLSPPIAH